jgi:uncharacterized protein (DUF2062 family)
VALGFFVGCFVPPGLHTIVVLILAFLFRTDKILAFAATWRLNPYTAPVLYPFFCFIGSHLIGVDLSFKHVDKEVVYVLHNFTWHNIIHLGREFAVSFFIGGFICGTVSALIGYYLTYRMIILYRNKRKKRKLAQYGPPEKSVNADDRITKIRQGRNK